VSDLTLKLSRLQEKVVTIEANNQHEMILGMQKKFIREYVENALVQFRKSMANEWKKASAEKSNDKLK